MFNFFDEIKKTGKNVKQKIFDEFNIVNLSGKLLYVEGVTTLLKLSKEIISFKVKNSIIFVEGSELIVDELSQNTIKISGKINKVEQV